MVITAYFLVTHKYSKLFNANKVKLNNSCLDIAILGKYIQPILAPFLNMKVKKTTEFFV